MVAAAPAGRAPPPAAPPPRRAAAAPPPSSPPSPPLEGAPLPEFVRLRVSLGGEFVRDRRAGGAWRYAGGWTFLETLPVACRWADVAYSLSERAAFPGGGSAARWALPGEPLDPDALAALGCDRDVLELYAAAAGAARAGAGEGGAPPRVRVFLSPAAGEAVPAAELAAAAAGRGGGAGGGRAEELGAAPLLPSARCAASAAAAAELAAAPPPLSDEEEQEEGVSGASTPSADAAAEMAWEAGFRAGRELALAELAGAAAAAESAGGARAVPAGAAWAQALRWRLAAAAAAPWAGVGNNNNTNDNDTIAPDLEDPAFLSFFGTKYETAAPTPARSAAPSAVPSPSRSPPPALRGAATELEAALGAPGSLPAAAALPAHISVFGDRLAAGVSAASAGGDSTPRADAAAGLTLPDRISDFGEGGGDSLGTADASGLPAVAAERAALDALVRAALADEGLAGTGAAKGAEAVAAEAALARVPRVDAAALAVLTRLGEGAFGEVSLCECPTFGRVAVKWLKARGGGLADGAPEGGTRRWAAFWREAELMSRLNHPNVLRFFGLATRCAPGGAAEAVAGIVVEHAAGGSLAAALRAARGPPPLRRRAHLAAGAARGLAYLHAKGVLHLDVKPDSELVQLRPWPAEVGYTLETNRPTNEPPNQPLTNHHCPK
jgi:hypothetical protein